MSQRLTELIAFYRETFRRFAPRQVLPEIVVEFYAYVRLSHTIRRRGERVQVRLSDLLADAPDEVQQALAVILVAKLLRRTVPPEALAVYRVYASQPRTAQAAEVRRQTAGHKFVSSPQGGFYNLERLFHKLNRRYFDGALPQPTLTWSQHEPRRILGHHDATHNTIVVSRALDAHDVPDWVVEFVLYHEMLHIKHPTRIINGRRAIHTAVFRADERLFPRYAEAQEWLAHSATSAPRAKKRPLPANKR